MKKKIILIIIFILLSALGIFGLYQTFALSGIITTSDNSYTVTATNGTTTTVPAGSSKTIYYKLTNTNNGTVKYGIGYKGTNITVKYYTDTTAPVTGTVEYGKSKFIKLYVENIGTTSSVVILSSILGYENGGDLIVPSGFTLVTEERTFLSTYITNLYNKASKTEVSNNNITYQYDTSDSLMKDVGGNIRYYGSSPNNYIYFNCSDYSNQSSSTCELWRIIGVFDGKIKLIRNESIGTIPFDNDSEDFYLQSLGNGNEEMVVAPLTYNLDDKEKIIKLAPSPGSENGQNDYSTSFVQKLLNNYYYYGLKYTGDGIYNFSSTGIKDDVTRNMIVSFNWSLLSGSSSVYVDQAYTDENTTGTVNDGNVYSWSGKIILPYASDYGYAADLNKCSQTLNKYSDSTCASNNWIKSILGSSNNSWLLNHSFSKYTWFVDFDGDIDSSSGCVSFCDGLGDAIVIPTFYLNSDIRAKLGTGSSSNPYQILVS